MRILHTADWHIGKKLAGIDLLADQKAIFESLVQLAEKEKVDAIIIAGDVYDRALPSEEAVQAVDQMLRRLNLQAHLPLLVISGNHDSAVRLNTGREWFQTSKLYLNTQLEQAFTPVTFGDCQFFLLPYFEPVSARLYFNDPDLTNIALAMAPVVKKMQSLFAPDKRHILIGHFFAAGSTHTDSETLVNVGGLDAVPTGLLAPFDYVALGHLHNRHALNEEKVQYSGSLLKFSVSEAAQQKGVYLLDTDTMKRQFIPIAPPHELQHLTASFADLTDPARYQKLDREAYTAVTLTDTQIIADAMPQLRQIFPRIFTMDRQNQVQMAGHKDLAKRTGHLAPLQLLGDFYQEVTGSEMDEKQLSLAKQALAAAKEEN